MKDLKYLQLLDDYGALLTDNRREICEMYYMLDLSLSEIAEQKGISRQSVSDTLRASRGLLDSYEEKLRGRAAPEAGIMMAEVVSALDKFKQLHPEFTRAMDEIIGMIAAPENEEK